MWRCLYSGTVEYGDVGLSDVEGLGQDGKGLVGYRLELMVMGS